jgi:hypothetical protein
MALFAQVGSSISSFLHHAIYAFPSSEDRNDSGNVTDSNPNPGLIDLLEPGESKAWMGGTGILSFAGSGYGPMLVLMVRMVFLRVLTFRASCLTVYITSFGDLGFHHNRYLTLRRASISSSKHKVGRKNEAAITDTVSLFLTSPDMPRYLRIPGLTALVRAWVLFSVILLQVAKLWPMDLSQDTIYGRALNRLGRSVGDMQMQQVCWQVFLSVCMGLICSGLANGLDRG